MDGERNQTGSRSQHEAIERSKITAKMHLTHRLDSLLYKCPELPVGQNNPQQCPYGLYPTASGTAFTAPRAPADLVL